MNPKLPTLYKTLYDIYQPLVGYRLPLVHWSGIPKGLDQLNKNLDHRRKTAALYDSYLLKTDCSPLFTISRSNDAALWRYPIFVDPTRRSDLLKHLWANEIDATMWYPPLNPMRSALMPDLAPCKTPHAHQWGASVINLPVDEGVTVEDVRRISALICDFFD
jgi:dTDP-4-amino-4,6-dideoxygalactose transaminase